MEKQLLTFIVIIYCDYTILCIFFHFFIQLWNEYEFRKGQQELALQTILTQMYIQKKIQYRNMYFSLTNQFIYYQNIDQKLKCYDHQSINLGSSKLIEKIELQFEFVGNKNEKISKGQILYVTFDSINLRTLLNYNNTVHLQQDEYKCYKDFKRPNNQQGQYMKKIRLFFIVSN